MMQTPEELVGQIADDIIATCGKQIGMLDMAEGDLKNLIRSIQFDYPEIAARLEPHVGTYVAAQEGYRKVRGWTNAALHTMPDRKVVHLTEEVF